MALKKEVDTNFGIKADYWRLDMFSYNKKDSSVTATFCLYKDSESAKEAKASLDTVSFQFTIEDLNKDVRIACYEKAKESLLIGAEDC